MYGEGLSISCACKSSAMHHNKHQVLNDVRSDTDATFHNHGVTVENVFDLQLHYCIRHEQRNW